MKEQLLNELKTTIIGQNVIYFDNIKSTQLEAKKIKNIVEDGTIIFTNNQTAGIGTHDRIWYMKENENIAFTIILKPKCNIRKISNITTIIAECMLETIEDLYNEKLYIKEPNDLMINGKKVGGILTQATTEAENVKDILIGIGLNVNQKIFPEPIIDIATSLKNEFNHEFNRIQIIANFLKKFEDRYIEMIN